MIKINRHSIFFNITVIFFISILFIVLTFYIVIKNDKKVHHRHIRKKYSRIIEPILDEIKEQNGTITKSTKDRLKSFNLEIIDTKNITKLKQSRSTYKYILKKYRIKIFQKGKFYYMYVKTPKINLLLKDNNSDIRSSRFLLLILSIIMFVLLFSYASIIKKLYPLKLLQNRAREFGSGNFNIECKIEGKDEIADLSNEFDKSIKNLKKLKNSRNIFLRNIMHELKTPIAKGRFLTKLPNDNSSKEKIDRVFIRLDRIINEFASIEELISLSEKVDKKEYFLTDIIDNAMDLLFENENSIVLENHFEKKKIVVNFMLFSIAVKNLIDNAIKYSDDKKALVQVKKDEIIFKSKGRKLKYPFYRYLEPFFKENKDSKESFGLGLYITNNILQSHNLTLNYNHKNGFNIFCFSLST